MDEHPVEYFVNLESQVWDALAGGDADADRNLLTGDFVGVYPTGFADRSSHTAQLTSGPTVSSYSIHDARLIPVSAGAVMLLYRASYGRLVGGLPAGDETMYVSSLWIERGGRWRNSFSQDTPAVPGT
jgi:hypothetical protein